MAQLEVMAADVTKLEVDAIANAANTQLAQVIAPTAPPTQSPRQQGQRDQLLVPAQPTNG